MLTRLLLACLLLPSLHADPRPLNVVFLLADDLGWADLACYGADLHETPNLDRLAREGVRFSQAYTMSVCSPTRAALLTGKHPARLHLTIWREGSLPQGTDALPVPRPLLPPTTISDLPHAELTLAELLHRAGYATFHIGKWHLGDAAHSPESHGFDLNIGGTHWGAPSTYFHPFRGPFGRNQEFRYVPGLGLGQPGQYLTDRLTDEALRAIDAARDRPFFLNLWFHSPHTPIQAPARLVRHFQSKLTPTHHHQNPDYAAMVASLDHNVGRILRHLDRRGLARHTLVIFMSDNGGTIGRYADRQVTDNYPLRSGKGSLYEGGIRVPLIVRLPNVTPRGAVCAEPVFCTDLFPTVADALGQSAASALDGLSLLPLLRQPNQSLPRDTLFFHYPHYYATTTPVSAVRAGNLKLLEFYEDHHLELYNLSTDP